MVARRPLSEAPEFAAVLAAQDVVLEAETNVEIAAAQVEELAPQVEANAAAAQEAATKLVTIPGRFGMALGALLPSGLVRLLKPDGTLAPQKFQAPAGSIDGAALGGAFWSNPTEVEAGTEPAKSVTPAAMASVTATALRIGPRVDTALPAQFDTALGVQLPSGLARIFKRDGTMAPQKFAAPAGSITLDMLAPDVAASIAAMARQVADPNLYLVGDSITASLRWGLLLGTALGRTATNGGIGGQTSIQIRRRFLGAHMVVSGGSVAAGSNSVTSIEGAAPAGTATAPSTNAMFLSTAADNAVRSSTGTFYVTGTDIAFRGTVTRTPSGGPPSTSETYTITPEASTVNPIACPDGLDFVPDVYGAWRNKITTLWLGRNNYNAYTTVLADIAAMVAARQEGDDRYLVLPPLNGNYASEYSGTGANYHYFTDYEADLAELYGDRYVPIRRILIDDGLAICGITPSAGDLTDISRDIVPRSLRTDDVHLNDYGNFVVFLTLLRKNLEMGW
ncbi:hypothetical protein ACO2Q0_02530 [Phenylobacterium sp. VNQ135]|uniref:hypothetical protein n=1 Tax=Phenylobacterium sp. VNQ135 TaxID=3400922 RepID=UPI003C114904